MHAHISARISGWQKWGVYYCRRRKIRGGTGTCVPTILLGAVSPIIYRLTDWQRFLVDFSAQDAPVSTILQLKFHTFSRAKQPDPVAGGGDPFRRYPPLVPDRVTQGPRYFHKFTPMSAPVTEALVKYVGLTELVHCVLLWTFDYACKALRYQQP